MEWFPEQEIWECGVCSREVPPEAIGCGYGFFITERGRRRKTTMLRSICPTCGMSQSLCVDGAWWRRMLFHGLWHLRYGVVARQPRRGRARI